MNRSEEMIVLTDAVLLTCIVQRGVAETVVQAAIEAGAQGATIFHARGTGIRQRKLGVLGLTVNAEKEVIYIVAPADQADRIFERIFIVARLDTPGMGLIYTTPLEKMATHVPHEIAARFGHHRAGHAEGHGGGHGAQHGNNHGGSEAPAPAAHPSGHGNLPHA